MGLKRRPWICISTKHVRSSKSHYIYLFVCLLRIWRSDGGQLARIGCFLPTRGLWGLNSDHQPWHQAPLPNEPSHESHKPHSFTEASVSWARLAGAYGTQCPSQSSWPWQPLLERMELEHCLTKHNALIRFQLEGPQTHKLPFFPFFPWPCSANPRETLSCSACAFPGATSGHPRH